MALTAFKASGDEVPASYIQSLITEVRDVSALKLSDQTVNNSTTFVNDNDLFCALAASASYAYELHLTQNSNGTANFKLNFTLPAGATMVRSNYWNATGAGGQHGSFTGTTVGGLTGAAGDAALDMWGYLTTSTTTGNLQLQWAQSTANVSDTIVRSGSFLVVRRLS